MAGNEEHPVLRAPMKRISLLPWAAIALDVVVALIVCIPPTMGIGTILILCCAPLIVSCYALAVTMRAGNKVRGMALAWIAAGLAVAVAATGCVIDLTAKDRLVSLGDERPTLRCRPYRWPDTEVARRVADPRAELAQQWFIDAGTVSMSFCGVGEDDYRSYVAQTKARGFETEYETETRFFGVDADGYTVDMQFDDVDGGVLGIYASDPENAHADSPLAKTPR